MAPPVFICTGMMRSGSTWSYNVCRLIGQVLSIQRKQPFGSAYLLDAELEKFLQTQLATAQGPTVIKVHRVGQLAFDFIHSGKARAVSTYRDPRDCVVSLRSFYGGELEEYAPGIAGSFELAKLYKMSSHTLFVRYEEMLADPLSQIRRIADHLDARLSDGELRGIERQTGISRSKEICDELKRRQPDEVLHSGSHRVDPVTSLHDNHIISGAPDRWRQELTSEQARWITRFFRPYLIAFGYETNDSLAALEDVWNAVATGLPEAAPTLNRADEAPRTSRPAAPHPSMSQSRQQ